MENVLIIISMVSGLLIGGVIGAYIKKLTSQQALTSATNKAQQILNQAKEKQQELLLAAKEKSIRLIDSAKKEEGERRREISRLQERLEKREEVFDKKILELESRQEELSKKTQTLENQRQELASIKSQQIDKLEKIAQLSQDDAKKILLENLERRSQEDLLVRMKKLQQVTVEELEQEANKVLADVIQRCASVHTS
jgi:ribonuclease Y